ncbi:ABC transporter ATP-binding protein [Pseudofulvibacter geojedonensis]|uniref:ABC transporter ATP-binding protein n=1 Tax=Pseudofulvibacter geojedonensis TaxID=1123758 RepID=A0ABW3HYI3_9FLAO
MEDVILKISNVSKQYRLGTIGTGTISHDVNRWWAKIRGKSDPYLKVGEENDRATAGSTHGYVWAIKDIDFEVKKGEVLGIIGKNGAGKSTLLKILSRVTGPTTGSIKSKGRIASLLEVGTGFHPEMTGRENIYLNGAILGMTKKEINLKIDEIIEFSGCQRYIDTPVKRYSSGMKVRLAFAVAAHLEPDILVVDEVLAVGDAEFQRKAIGKMQDISTGEGRTVLFVSHNMAAVETLCTRAISLNNGKVEFEGRPSDVISKYLNSSAQNEKIIDFEQKGIFEGNDSVQILYAGIENTSSTNIYDVIDITNEFILKIKLLNKTQNSQISVGYDLMTLKGDVVFGSGSMINSNLSKETIVTCTIPSNFLNNDVYQICLYIHDENMKRIYLKSELLVFEVKDVERENGFLGKVNGVVRPKLNWNVLNS